MKTILVTGGAGYIGSHACKALAQAGCTPVAYDNLVYGHDWAVKWGPLEIGDIADRARLDAVIAAHRPSAVMHFAAYAYVGESVTDPFKYYRNNVAGTLTLLEAMRDHGINRMIFSSSCATYGVPEKMPIPESHRQQPINPYGASKLMVERMLADAGAAHGLRSIALRYFNAAGADPETEIGEDHDPETHLIPLVLDAAAGRRPHITIFGDDYPTPDGSCIRDYIHVTDLAQAHVLALKELEHASGLLQNHPQFPLPAEVSEAKLRLREGQGEGREEGFATNSSPNKTREYFRAYNLGNGQGFSVKEVIATAEKVTGRTIPVRMGERRPGDPPILIGNAEKMISELGWHPEYADLESIVKTAWQWHQK